MPRTVTISTSKLNSYGFRMLTEGADLKQFEKNPILLFMHNRPWRGTQDEILALGRVENIRIENDAILGDLVFDQNDPFAKKIEAKWDAGIYKMVSAGATPIELSDDPKHLLPGQTRRTVTKWKLEEVSVVDIAANDDAIALKSPKGDYITLKEGECPDFIPTITNKNEKKMEKILLALGLGKDATEDQAVAAIQAQQSEHQTLKLTLKAEGEKAITLAVDSAIREKRIKEEQKTHFLELGGKVGIDLLSKTLENIEPAIKPTEIIAGKGGKAPINLSEKKWADLTAEERVHLRNEDKPNYIKLFNAEYGYDPKMD
jgi:hypothetical protein